MSPNGRPKGEYRSPQDGGSSMTPNGRPKGECRSPQDGGSSMTPHGRPKGEYRSPQDGACPILRALAKSPMITSGQSPLFCWRLA